MRRPLAEPVKLTREEAEEAAGLFPSALFCVGEDGTDAALIPWRRQAARQSLHWRAACLRHFFGLEFCDDFCNSSNSSRIRRWRRRRSIPSRRQRLASRRNSRCGCRPGCHSGRDRSINAGFRIGCR
jgi:hypothetical protein